MKKLYINIVDEKIKSIKGYRNIFLLGFYRLDVSGMNLKEYKNKRKLNLNFIFQKIRKLWQKK